MRTAAAEFTGTFFVVLVPGLLLMQGSPGELAGVAGAAIYAAMAAANHPGGHFHPVVSLAAWMAGRISFGSWVLRVAAQAAGAAAAGAAVAALFGRAEASFSPEPGRALVLELAFIFALCWVFLRALPGNPGLPAGLVLLAGGLAARPVSGAIFNPASALGWSLAHLLDARAFEVVLVASAVAGVGAGALARLFPREAAAAPPPATDSEGGGRARRRRQGRSQQPEG